MILLIQLHMMVIFSIEEEDALDAGAIVEVGQELMYTTALNATTNTITVKRGQEMLLLLHIQQEI